MLQNNCEFLRCDNGQWIIFKNSPIIIIIILLLLLLS